MGWIQTIFYLVACFNLAFTLQKCVEVERCKSYVNLLNYLSVSFCQN